MTTHLVQRAFIGMVCLGAALLFLLGTTFAQEELTEQLQPEQTNVAPSSDLPVETGTIVIVLDTISNDAQDFVFHNNFGGSYPDLFTLDDDGNINNALTKSLSFDVPTGVYSVTQDTVSGWYLETSCSNGNSIDAITLTSGESITCTFENYQAAQLTISKNTDGKDAAFTFGFSGLGLPTTDSLATTDGTAEKTYANLNPNLVYVVGEYAMPGWEQVDANCTGTNTPADVTPNTNETVVCTFSNVYTGAELRLEVQVVTDDGGNNSADDFVLKADNANHAFLQQEDQTFTIVDANSLYELSYNGPLGYEAGAWSCDGGLLEGAELTLQSGDVVTCSITFDDIPPTLTLLKSLAVQYGATQSLGDFTLLLNDDPVAQGDQNQVVANTDYRIGEETVDGWTFVTISGAGCPQELNEAIQLNEGENVECTIVNADLPNTIEGVVYHDTNMDGTQDNDEDGLPGITVSASDGSMIFETETDSDGMYEFINLPAGNYTLTQMLQTDWWQTTVNPDEISLTNGESASGVDFGTATFGQIVVIKEVLGLSDETQFNFSTDYSDPFILQQGASLSSSLLVPGAYSVAEVTIPDTFELLLITCDDGNSTVDQSAGIANITLESEEVVTCVFTNRSLDVRIDGITREEGFWRNHTRFTSDIFINNFLEDLIVGEPPRKFVSNLSELFGGFFADKERKTNRKKRETLDIARMLLLEKILSSELNCVAFGCSLATEELLEQAHQSYSGTSTHAMRESRKTLNHYNESGEDEVVDDAGRATPRESKRIADEAFWDIP